MVKKKILAFTTHIKHHHRCFQNVGNYTGQINCKKKSWERVTYGLRHRLTKYNVCTTFEPLFN